MKPESVSRFDSMSEEEQDAMAETSGYASADELREAMMRGEADDDSDFDPRENWAAMDLNWDDR